MKPTSHSAAKAFTSAFESPYSGDRNPGYAAEQDEDILFGKLSFAESLFPDKGLSLCPISHSKIKYISKSCQNVFGHPHHELAKMALPDFFMLIHPDDLPSVQQCFEYMSSMVPFDPERYRFIVHYRSRTKTGEYVELRTEHIALKVTDSTYLYLMLYGRVPEAEKFHHVHLEIHRKVNGSFVKTGVYHPKQRKKEMTPRQSEIARLVANGFTNQDIADQLGVSIFTIKNHKKMLFRKINVKSSLELASYVKQNS